MRNPYIREFFDSQTIEFLDGYLEYFRIENFKVVYKDSSLFGSSFPLVSFYLNWRYKGYTGFGVITYNSYISNPVRAIKDYFSDEN